MARPTKLTPETHEQIVRALTAGATRTDAAMSAGVLYDTFLNWMARGAKSKSGQFFQFFNAVVNAEATVRIALANSLAVAGKTDWRAAEAYLKRRDRANWGDALQVSRMTDDELLRIIALTESGEGRSEEARPIPASGAPDGGE